MIYWESITNYLLANAAPVMKSKKKWSGKLTTFRFAPVNLLLHIYRFSSPKVRERRSRPSKDITKSNGLNAKPFDPRPNKIYTF